MVFWMLVARRIHFRWPGLLSSQADCSQQSSQASLYHSDEGKTPGISLKQDRGTLNLSTIQLSISPGLFMTELCMKEKLASSLFRLPFGVRALLPKESLYTN